MNKPRKVLLWFTLSMFKIGSAVLLITHCFERYLGARALLPDDNSFFYCYLAGSIVGGVGYVVSIVNLLVPDRVEESHETVEGSEPTREGVKDDVLPLPSPAPVTA